MSDLAKVIGRQIEALRNSKGLKKTELANLLGVTRQTLDNYIKGKQIIDSAKLAVLARSFNKSMDYFLKPDDDQRFSLLFRAENASAAPDEIIDRIHRHFELYLQLLEHVDRKVAFNPPTYWMKIDHQELTDEDKRRIEDIAAICRQALSLEGVTGEDLFMGLEDAGVNIIAFPTDPDNEVWGASAHSLEYGAFIYVNDHPLIPEERKIFSLIHELGHLILHRDKYASNPSELKYASRKSDLAEKVADHFAGSFLLPRDRLRREWFDDDLTLSELFHLKRKFKISIQAVIKTLHNYGYITDAQKDDFLECLYSRGYRKAEPDPLPYIMKNHRLNRLAMRLYFDGEISMSKAAEYLGISLLEARELVKKWGVEC